MTNGVDLRFGELGLVAREKLRTNNDIKVLIVGANAQTGVGKTTLAVQLCRYLDDNWNAEDRSFVDVQRYMNYMSPKSEGGAPPKGSAVLLDEIEHGADRRRPMSNDNIGLRQAWMKMRAYNVAHIATTPSMAFVDSDLLKLADYWVLVEQRGVAQAHRISVNDYNPKKRPSLQRTRGKIIFPDLPDDDPDKAYLDGIKDRAIAGDASMQRIPISEHKELVEKAVEDAKREERNEFIRELYGQNAISEKYDIESISSTAIAELDCVDVTRQHITENIIE